MVVFIVLIVFSLLGRKDQPIDYPPYLSTSPSPTGTKALYTYITESDVKTKRWYKTPSDLSKERDSILIMVEPSVIPTKEEQRDYEDFMKNGNQLILFSESFQDLFQIETGFDLSFDEDDEEGFHYDGDSYQLMLNKSEYIEPIDGDIEFLTDSERAYGIKRSYGDGELILVHASSFLVNGFITEEENAEFITTFLADVYSEGDQVLFDEYIHDVDNLASYKNAYPFWFIVLLLQGVILTVLWLLYKGKRFGPIYTPREADVRFSDESITALASWHMRGKRYQDSLHIQADYIKQLLYEKWHVPYRLSWQESEAYIKRKWERDDQAIEQFIKELTIVLAEDELNKNEYVKWSKQLDDLRKEVESR